MVQVEGCRFPVHSSNNHEILTTPTKAHFSLLTSLLSSHVRYLTVTTYHNQTSEEAPTSLQILLQNTVGHCHIAMLLLRGRSCTYKHEKPQGEN